MLSVGGLGVSRLGPLWASLVPAGVAAVMALAGAPRLWMLNAVGGVLMVYGIASCLIWGRRAVEIFGRRNPREVVADKVAGCSIVVAEAVYYEGPAGRVLVRIAWAVALFRLINGPLGRALRELEKLRGGWGLIVYDVVTGVIALLLFNLSMMLAKQVGLR